MLFGGFGHWLQLFSVIAVLSHFMVQNQAMCGVHGGLYVVGHPWPFGRTHHSGIAFMGVELLQAHRAHQRLAALIVVLPNFKLRQCCFDRAAINHLSSLGLVGLIQLRQILSYALVQLFFLTLELFEVHVPPRGSDSLKLTAIDGHQVACDQTRHAAELNEGATRRHKGKFIVLRKSAMVLKSGLSRLISHITSILR